MRASWRSSSFKTVSVSASHPAISKHLVGSRCDQRFVERLDETTLDPDEVALRGQTRKVTSDAEAHNELLTLLTSLCSS